MSKQSETSKEFETLMMNGPREGEKSWKVSESNVAGRFTLLLGNVTDCVFDDILIFRIENLAFPEGKNSKEDEDDPNSTHKHSHDGVPYEETV